MSYLGGINSNRRAGFRPFYLTWHHQNHEIKLQKSNGNCCFYHIIGPATKDGKDMPLLPYQKLLYQMLHERKQIWIKKSRGLGVTTFFLYWISYCCLTKCKAGDRVCVIVGPRIDLAEDFIARFKGLFRKNCSLMLEIDKTQEISMIEDPNEEIQPAISTIPTPGYGDVAIKKQPNYKGSFAEMAKRVKFTSYEVRDGAGRPIHEE